MTKRRDLLKGLGLGAVSLAFSGCSNNDNHKNDLSNHDNDEFEIVPKQTAIHNFSVPLPFNFKTLDEIAELNSVIKKSKVTSFYNNTPLPLAKNFNQWIQVVRGKNKNIKNYKDFAKFVKYAHDNNIKFTYLMNSPKPFSQEDFQRFKSDFLYLLDFLKSINCKDIKIANTQVADLIYEYAPNEFNFSASTNFCFHAIGQYEALFDIYPNFNLIDIDYNENRNFKLLKALKTRFPKVKIELMVNETCIKFCPSRVAHMSELYFKPFNCYQFSEILGGSAYSFLLSSIFPWDLDYYSALGINNFKFIAYGNMQSDNNRNNFVNIDILTKYLDLVDNYDENMLVGDFFYKCGLFIVQNDNLIEKLRNMTFSQIRQYLPDIKHFVKYGDKCASQCRTKCSYCFDCAKKFDNFVLYDKDV